MNFMIKYLGNNLAMFREHSNLLKKLGNTWSKRRPKANQNKRDLFSFQVQNKCRKSSISFLKNDFTEWSITNNT